MKKDKKKSCCDTKEHWVMDIGATVFATGHGNDPAGAFLARPGKDRATPHKKINECDY